MRRTFVNSLLGSALPSVGSTQGAASIPVQVPPPSDERADASVAINRAILAADGGRVVLAAGVYRLRSPIILDREGTILEGASRGGRLVDRNSGGTVLLAATQDIDMAVVTKRYVQVRDLCFDGDGRARRGIRADMSKGTLNNVTVARTNEFALHLRDASGGQGPRAFSWRVIGSAIYDNFGYGIYADAIAGNDTHVAYSVFGDNRKDAVRIAGRSVTVTITGCDLENNCLASSDPESAYIFLGQNVGNVRIQGCHFENDRETKNTVSFVRTRGPSSVTVIEGCYFNDAHESKRLSALRVLGGSGSVARVVRVSTCIVRGMSLPFVVHDDADFVSKDNDVG